jgi:photosystem II stability/assembly factor-like uncharacterized protein
VARTLCGRAPVVVLLVSAIACQVPPPKLASQARPPQPAPQAQPPRPKDSETDRNRQWQAWNDRRHRTPPGMDWRRIESDNVKAALAARARLAHGAAAATAANSVPWHERGAMNQTGRTWVTAVAGDGDTLLVGTDNGGLFSGTPQAATWTERAGTLGTGVHQLVAVPGPPETWTAVANDETGTPFSPDQGATAVSVSADQGATWSTPGGLPVFWYTARILREPGASRTVYLLAIVAATTLRGAPGFVVCRSDDGGLNYVAAFSGSSAPVPDLWMDRVNPGPLYLLAANTLFASADKGASFTPVGGFSAESTSLRLAGSEAGAPYFYAAVRISGPSRLFASEDGGKTWTARATLPFDYDNSIAASISNPAIVVVGGVNGYRSTDAGATFAALNNWGDYWSDPAHLLHADLRGLDWTFYRGAETLFVDTDGGTYMSVDLGATVSNLTQFGMGNAEYYSTVTSRGDPDLIAAGSQDQGLQVSHPAPLGAMAFSQVAGGDYGHLDSPAGDFDPLYAVYPGTGAVGSGFILVLGHPQSPPMTLETVGFPPATRDWMPDFLTHPVDTGAVYLTGSVLWLLKKIDRTWQSAQYPQDFSEHGFQDYLTALAISPVDPRYFYAASAQGRLWSSHDGGGSWTLSSSHGPVAPFLYGSALLASPTVATTCFVAGSGYGGPAVYKTTDGGETWTPMSDGLPSTLVNGLAFDNAASQTLYAAADAGAFVYDDQAARWRSIVDATAPINFYWAVESVPAIRTMRFATYGRGIWDYSPTGRPCAASDQVLCTTGNRFSVSMTWRDGSGNTGAGHAVPLTGDTGYFWFFDPASVEVVVKTLDGCALGNNFWVFAGGLTDVEVTMTVLDGVTGQTKTYLNPLHQRFQPIQDTGAFPTCGAAGDAPARPALAPAPAPAPAVRRPDSASPTCTPTATSLCLGGGRFKVEATWATAQASGTAQAVSLTPDTGYLWFFDAANVEAVVKVIDGCALGGQFWVFAGGLTNVEVNLTVTDTATGASRTYLNPPGTPFQPIQDTRAFGSCP